MQIMMLRASQLRSLGLEMYLTLRCDCHGAGYIVAATIQANGINRYQLMCCACGHAYGGAIAPAKLPQHIRDTAALIANNIDAKNRCARCGSDAKGVELHHWAPFARFRDFDRWPTSMLCIDCHEEWHSEMNGYQWQPNLRRSSSR
jgi:hypothetical protein